MSPQDIPDEPFEAWLDRTVDQHQRALLRYAQHLVGDAQRAQDVVQDTFLKLCDERAARPMSPSHLRRWLYTVCRNRAIDVVRKEMRMNVASNRLVEQPATVEAGPESALMEQERQDALMAQIHRLPPNQQEVIRLKFHAGMSYQEIAEVTGLSRSNVGYLLHTAITRLRERMSL